ncbi:hypothetical protein SpCBS45565_g08371 [Spizellomyces sp. 'palustris']|nr:hypothetical protein SpCBS45565_g08371 [Spizellomyces sp. 'palustris']
MSGINSRNSTGLRTVDNTNLLSPYVTGEMVGFDAGSKIKGFAVGEFKHLSNQNGELEVNSFKTTSECLPCKNEDGVVSVSLNVDNKRLEIDGESQLTTIDVTAYPPLHYSKKDHDIDLLIDDSSLSVEQGKLTVLPNNYEFPLYRDDESRTVSIRVDETLSINENGLSVDFPPPPPPETLKKPLYRDQNGLGLKLHKSLKVNNEDQLETNTTNLFKAFGAIKTVSDADSILEIRSDFLDFGFSSLSELTDALGDVDSMVIRLMTDTSTFSQAGSRLSLKSPGYEQILYGNMTYGFSGNSALMYSTMLQELRVPNVKLTGMLPAIGGGSYIVSKDYLSNYYQGSSTGAISVGVESAGHKEISCQVDNQTIRIVGNKLTGGYIFQSFNGLSVQPGTNNDIQLDLKCEAGSGLAMVKADTIKYLFTASQGIERINNDFRLSLVAKQPDLTLQNGVLSCNITAGIGLQKNGAVLSTNLRGINGVQVSGDLISCSLTGSDTVLRVGDTLKGNYIGSTNAYGSVIVVGNTIQYNMIPPQFVSNGPNLIITGSYPLYNFTLIDPMQLSKQRDTDNTEHSDTAEVLKTDVSGGNVVVLSGATPLTAIPFPAIVAPPATILMAVNSILPIVGTFRWGMVFGGSRQCKVQRDAQGQPILDGDGNPVYEAIDPVTFMPPLEPGSNVAIASDPIGGCTRLLFDTPSCYRGIKYEFPQQAINLGMLRDYDTEVIKPWVGSQMAALTSNNITFGGNVTGKVISGTRTNVNSSAAGYAAPVICSSFDGSKSTWLGVDGIGMLNFNPNAATWLGAQDLPMYIYPRTSSMTSLGLRLDTNGSCTFGADVTLNTAVNGLRSISISNNSGGTNAASIFYLSNAAGSAYMFLNGNGRSVDGGVNCLTLRNDVGATKIQSQGSKGLSIAATTGNITLDSTTDSSFTITGALQVSGGVGIKGNIYMGKYAIISSPTAAAFQINNATFGFTDMAGQWFQNTLTNDYIICTSGSNLRIGTNGATASNLDVLSSGNVVLNTTLDATSTTTGSLQIKGGVGIAKLLYVGGDIYTNNVKLATESYVGTSISSKQNASPLLDSISSLTMTPNTFIMGTSGGFTVSPVSTILGGYQPLLTTSLALTVNSLMTSGGIIVQGASDMVFRVDNTGDVLASGGLLVEKDLNVEGTIIQNRVEVATQKFVINNTTPISQALSSLTTTVTNNNNNVTNALTSKQPMNSTTNSLYTMAVQPDSWLYSSGGTTFENVTSTQVKGNLDIATNASMNTLLAGKQNNITAATSLTLASITANGYLTVQNASSPILMSIVNTGSNVTWGLRVAGSSADGVLPAGGFGLNCLYNNIGYVFKVLNNGVTQITSTTDSSSTATGALQVSGGVGVKGNIYMGKYCIISSATAAAFQINNSAYGFADTAGQWFQNTLANDYIIREPAAIYALVALLSIRPLMLPQQQLVVSKSKVEPELLNRSIHTDLCFLRTFLIATIESFVILFVVFKTPAEVRSILGVDTDLAGKQNKNSLLDAITTLTPTSGMFVMSDNINGFILQSASTVKTMLNLTDYSSDITNLQTSISTKQDVLTPSSNLSVSTIIVNSTVDSTTVSTGALQVQGGLGISKNIFAGGNITGKVLIATSTGGYLKLRSNISATKADYTISYNNSGDNLHVHLAGSADPVDQHYYQFGYYTNDSFSSWNSRFQVNTYNGDLVSAGNLTIGNANTNGLHSLVIKNTDPGSNAAPIYYLTTAAGSAYMCYENSEYGYGSRSHHTPYLPVIMHITELPEDIVVDGKTVPLEYVELALELIRLHEEDVERSTIMDRKKCKVQAINERVGLKPFISLVE